MKHTAIRHRPEIIITRHKQKQMRSNNIPKLVQTKKSTPTILYKKYQQKISNRNLQKKKRKTKQNTKKTRYSAG